MRKLLLYLLAIFTLLPIATFSSVKDSSLAESLRSVPRILFFDETSVNADSQESPVNDQLNLDQIADSLTQKVLGENKVVDMLDPEKVYTLPLGIVKEIGGMYYTIVLDNLKFTPSGAVMKAYMSVSFPGSTKKFGLVADNVKIGVNGIESAQLKMLKDKALPLMGQELVIDADSTYIEWDCNGYKSAQLSATLFLDEGKFFKENPTTRTITTGAKVGGRILCTVTDFNDILLSVSLDPFQVNGLKDYSFYPKSIVLDLSDTRNPDGIQFPAGYESVLFDGENKNLWRGLYISSFSLKFPKTFAKEGPAPEIAATKFLIDLEGISGSLAYNAQILSFDKGNLGGWKFSINSVSLSLTKNEITGYGMAGGIILPITEANKPMSYSATIDADKNFLFTVSLPGNINAPLFGSGTTLTLASNSKITVESKDGVYYPKAELHGKMKVSVGGSPGVSLADITFQGLVVQTRQPQIDIQAFSMTSGAMAGFPVQINGIALERNNKDTLLGLKFDASVNLMEEKIAGTTAFVVWAKHNKGDWKYKDIELRKIAISANTGAITLKGGLENFKDDATYGNGYLGYVDMSMTPGIRVYATAQFGNVSGFRYWFADAGVTIPTGISIFPGFGIYGFGGGAYYHMERTLPDNIRMVRDTSATLPPPPKIGISKSGVTYKPSKNIALGVMAKVIIGTQPKPDAFNGSVTFGMEFNSNFGINQITFQGDGRFMTEINKDGSDSKVKATVNIQYLVSKKELSGYAEAFINVADIIKGGGPNNKAGRVDFYFAPKEWYIYIGTPSSPINLKLMKLLSAKSYFMVGSVLPDFPPLPANLSKLTNKIDFSNMRQKNLAKSGGGFAFGASVLASTGEQRFLIFYGKFELGAGFDFMLKNFGENALCEGHSGDLGINGWYAQGQAWAWVDAKVGIKVRVFRKKRNFTIISAGFAAVLGAQLPNPTYLAGAVEARYSVAGGLVRGKCHFEFSYGNQCKLVGVSELAGVTAISEVTPAEGTKEVDVFTTPQVVFNMPIEEAFEVLDENGNAKKFRATLDYFKLMQGETEIPCAKEWNSTMDVLALRPMEILPGQTGLKAKVKVHFQEKEGDAGWVDYTVDGNVESEEQMVVFGTGDAPDYITENNVNYTYPVRNMVNFYKNEHGNMYIQLHQGVNYLFTKPGNWRYEAHFKSGQNTSKMQVTYDSNAKRVMLNVPDNLVNNSIYSMKIVRVEDTNNGYTADANVVRTETSVNEDLTLASKTAEGALTDENTVELYTLYFRSSKFNSMNEKLNSLSKSFLVEHINQASSIIKLKLTGEELFDAWEVENIKVESVLDETKWYTYNYKDLLYSTYPIASGMDITWRNMGVAGMPPSKSCVLIQSENLPYLTQTHISTGVYPLNSNIISKIENRLSYYIAGDYVNLKGRAFSYYPNATGNQIIENIKQSNYKGMYYNSKYFVKVMYVLPGEDRPTSEFKTYIEI